MEDEINFVDILIEEVKKQECLYDKRNSCYFNRNVKERAWKKVAEKCIKSVADCKHRWKLLRERFVKEIKRMEAPSGIGMYYLEEWKFLQPLMFLKDSLAPRRTRDNVEERDVESVLEQSLLSSDTLQNTPTSAAPTKKKPKGSFDSLCQKFSETIDKLEKNFSTTGDNSSLDDAFLSTASCIMKELPQAVKEEFQSRMLQELYQLRREQSNN